VNTELKPTLTQTSIGPSSSSIRSAAKITADMGKAIHPTGRWKRAECDERVDAALLPSVLRGAIP